ncbi:hypothetical protein [Chroococcidiopsis sp. CCMEE 29]|uniref:hypothetical protein n=1 Tax=Chroococcidiopsis sp. CCMEE 29 TaxID=155894 RepID=UPI00202052F6|nr:hypothetical protein [Chroococcidiopsis sp. CCMEE 29]
MEELTRKLKVLLIDDEIENCEDKELLAGLAARCEALLDRIEYRLIELEEPPEDEAA